jgi:hypothetical protein
MPNRLTSLALLGAVLVGAAACADAATTDDLERALIVEEAKTTGDILDPDERADLAEVISDVADIASVVPGLFDYEPDSDIVPAGDFELTCAGGLEPTVIFIGRSSTTWPDVDVAEASAELFGARVCTYDTRDAGTPAPSTPVEIAAEATAATAGIRATGSLTVVGRADAPEAAELFGDQHPGDVVGLTLVEPGSGWTDLDWRDLYGR